MSVLAEVCPRSRKTKECVTAFREGLGEEAETQRTMAALRHDVGRTTSRHAGEPLRSIYRNGDKGMARGLQHLSYVP